MLSGNQVQGTGGSIFAAAASNVIVADATTISNCSAKYGAAVYLFGSGRLVFDGAIVQGNRAREFGGGLDSGGKATVVVNGSSWSSNSANWGGAIDTYQGVKMHIHNSTFSDNHARYSGGAAEIAGAAGLNLVTILNSSFVNNSAPNGGAIALKEDADLSIAAGSRLAGNHATSAGGAVQLQGTARLQVSGSALENNTAAEGGAVAALEASSFEHTGNSICSSNAATSQGGCIAAKGTAKAALLQGSTLAGNSAPIGGGLHAAHNASVLLGALARVQGNHARTTGGGIYIADAARLQASPGSSIRRNSAGSHAGGVALSGSHSHFKDMQAAVTNNSAKYDADVMTLTSSITVLGNSTVLGFASRPGSGEGLLHVQLQVAGMYGLPADGNLVQALLLETNSILAVNRSESTGLIHMTFKVRVPPGWYTLNFSLVETIDLSSLGVAVPPAQLRLQVRRCVEGEVVAGSSDACQPCLPGTFSLNPSNASCDSCPAGASCPGMAALLPLPGWWHSNTRSAQIHRCPNPTACRQARSSAPPADSPLLSTAQPQAACAAGHKGTLCGSCSSGYALVKPFTCRKCMRKAYIVAIYVAGAVALLAVMKLQCSFNRAEAAEAAEAASSMCDFGPAEVPTQPELTPSSVVQPLVVYLQWAALVVTTPDYAAASTTMTLLSTSVHWVWSAASPEAINFACVLAAGAGPLPAPILRQLFYLMSPVMMVAALLLIEGLSMVIRRRKTTSNAGAMHVMHQLLSTSWVVAFFYLPSVARHALSMFACVRVDAAAAAPYAADAVGRFWVLDVSQQCLAGYHKRWALGLGLPVAVAVCCLPVGVALFLAGNRRRLQDQAFQLHYGYLFKHYKPACAWYEACTMCQTLLLVVLSVFSYSIGPFYCGLLTVACLAAFAAMLMLLRPYAHPVAGKLMLAGISTLLVTSWASLLLLPYGPVQPSNGTAFAEAISIVLLLLNIAFLVAVVTILVKAVRWRRAVAGLASGFSKGSRTLRRLSTGLVSALSSRLLSSSMLFSSRLSSSLSVQLQMDDGRVASDTRRRGSSFLAPIIEAHKLAAAAAPVCVAQRE
uniref:Right handed beta helix domain-containing protein n=1 Tax=Tetradesmus obliquus TaxID=3088 RepID=A0A383W3X7_TETOB|eukprot:jgi/Sobl393_1/2997/SZX71839.1